MSVNRYEFVLGQVICRSSRDCLLLFSFALAQAVASALSPTLILALTNTLILSLTMTLNLTLGYT